MHACQEKNACIFGRRKIKHLQIRLGDEDGMAFEKLAKEVLKVKQQEAGRQAILAFLSAHTPPNAGTANVISNIPAGPKPNPPLQFPKEVLEGLASRAASLIADGLMQFAGGKRHGGESSKHSERTIKKNAQAIKRLGRAPKRDASGL
jgi:hypothetical protein